MDLVEMNAGGAQRHPWEEARSHFFLRLLRDRGLLPDGAIVLDAGAGDAWFARQLAAAAPGARIACWDAGYTPEILARVAAGAPPALTFSSARPGGRFDLLLLLDVLEHVQGDRAFLGGLVRDAVAPGGRVLVSVPAWPILMSGHDGALGHLRRYTPAAARELLRGAGLTPILSGGLFGTLLPLRAVAAFRDRVLGGGVQRPASDGWGSEGRAAAVARQILSWDARLSLAAARRGLELPGLSWWALCRTSS